VPAKSACVCDTFRRTVWTAPSLNRAGGFANQNTKIEKVGKISFSMTSAAGLQFRVVDKSIADFRFECVDLERISDSIAPISKIVATTELVDAAPAVLRGPPTNPGGACYVDSINNLPPAVTLPVERSSGLQMLGWAGEPDRDAPADQVYGELLSRTGQSFWVGGNRMLRPAVAKALGKPGLSESDFMLSVAPRRIPAGTYGLKILLVEKREVHESDLKR
jgi:hypothetical protein